jgi:hypothetical protein
MKRKNLIRLKNIYCRGGPYSKYRLFYNYFNKLKEFKWQQLFHDLLLKLEMYPETFPFIFL